MDTPPHPGGAIDAPMGTKSVQTGSFKIPALDPARIGCVAIGSSTGAPTQLQHIIAGLPADLPVPILIAQHLPPAFSASFANTLGRVSPLTVVHAEDGMPLLPGSVYVAQGHKHMRVRRWAAGRLHVEISERPAELPFKPSVDELLASCAKHYGATTLAFVMTGIGRDGTLGAGEVRAAGGVVVAQDEASCAVWGMPRSCAEAGFASAVMDPEHMRRTILQLSPGHHREAHAG